MAADHHPHRAHGGGGGGGGGRAGGGTHGQQQPELPADAVAVRGILRSMGAEEAEPRVLAMLLDFVYTYAAEVLQDAEAYGEALGRPPGTVELGELGFAMQARGAHSFCQPPPQDLLQKVADEVNALDLPEFPLKHGLRLPPNDDCLVMPNWELGPPAGAAGAAAAGQGGKGRGSGGGGGGAGRQQQQAAAGGGGAAPMDTS